MPNQVKNWYDPPAAEPVEAPTEADGSIARAQLARMVARYGAAIAAWSRLNARGAVANAQHMERAAQCCEAAAQLVADGDLRDVRHLVGLVQGVLLCAGVHNWEYLASDDARR